VFVALRVRDLKSSARFYRNVEGIPLSDPDGNVVGLTERA